MRHIAVGEPCPIDATPVGRTHCSACPWFVSFRSGDGVATVGCSWGEDVAAWLRREMSVSTTAGGGPLDAPLAGRDSAFARRLRRPRSPRVRSRSSFGAGASLGIFIAAVGMGLALSALERSD
ncbi:MAG TPA: hypothetical protein VLA44_09555 [Clostridia bacterium]|nr:hypothetical protein [Clostridia bacterium]